MPPGVGTTRRGIVLLESALVGALRQGLLYEQLLIRRVRGELVARLSGSEVSPEEVQEVDRLLHLLGFSAGTP